MAKKRSKRSPSQPPNPGGRPTTLDTNVQEEIVKYVREGNPFSLSCELAGVSKATGKDWLSRGEGRDPDRARTEPFATFASAVRHAEARFQRDRVLGIVQAAQGRRVVRSKVVTKTYHDRDGNEVTETTIENTESLQSDWHADRYLLEQASPELWGSNRMAELQAWQVLIEAGQVPATVIDALLQGEDERRSRIQRAVRGETSPRDE